MPQAGLASEDDDEVGVYADNKGAVLITDDRALSRLRRVGVFGQVVEMRGRKVDAVKHVQSNLSGIMKILQQHEEVVIAVGEHGAWITAPPHLRQDPPTPQKKARAKRRH